jgi:hypothetical protein
MSRGLGRIERALAAIFDSERDNAFTLEDLCERVYPDANQVEKKHRVSVTRAARSLARSRPEIQWMEGGGLGGALVFFRRDEVMSYAMARLKALSYERYRSRDPRFYWTQDERKLRDKLDDKLHRELVGPGGVWRRHVDIFLATRDGDTEKAERLEAEEAARREAWLQGARVMFSGMRRRVTRSASPSPPKHSTPPND